MSTVAEVIAAASSGMRVLGLSLLTNMAAGILEQPITSDEVLEVSQQASQKIAAIIDGVLDEL
jgi:purine-nucleoside phosphorylase